MDIFTQKKALIIIIIILVVLNLTSVGFFIWKEFYRKPMSKVTSDKDREISAVLKEELNLNESQAEQIKKLRSGFIEKEKILSEIIRSQRDSMNAVMFNKNTDEELVKSLARRVADNEYQMEILRYEQAQEFKKICTPEQVQKFEELVKEIRDYFRPDKPGKK